MGAPHVGLVNLVVPDAGAAGRFLAELGVELPDVDPDWADWAGHHRGVPAGPGFGIDLDSAAFASWWGGLPEGFAGVVVNVTFDERAEVDEHHDRAVALGATSRKAPHDAFWGSRYALVEAPGPLMVGLMTVADPAHRGQPPALSDFT